MKRFAIVLCFLLIATGLGAETKPSVPTGNGVGMSNIGYCDDKLAASDWTATTVVAAPPVTSAFTKTSVAAGGNPAQYVEIQLQPGANGVVKVAHLMNSDQIDQKVDGGIVDVSGTIDVKRIAGNRLVQVALLVEQNGVYFSGPSQTVTSFAWATLSWNKLPQTAFTNVISGGRPLAPMFQCDTRATRVGFLTTTSITMKDRPKIGVDNWCVTVRTRCCQSGGRTLGRSCCDQPLEVDKDGGILLPDVDPSFPPQAETVDEFDGPVGTLYPGVDTSTDLWYGQQPCDSCVGGTAPPEATNPDIVVKDLDAKPEEIRDVVDTVEHVVGEHENGQPPSFQTIAKLSGTYTPRGPRKLNEGPFRGRDIVFVHGLDPEALLARLDINDPNHAAASTTWVTPTIFTQSDKSENPQYYQGGYFRNQADAAWSAHINHYLAAKKNRYLVVAYNSNERMDVAVQGVLRQVADAMMYGEGVIDPANPSTTVTDFGTPSLVFVSYSTGCPLTDIALAAASMFPSLGVDFIPNHTKALIAAHGVFAGSRYASAALVASGLISSTPPWACGLVNKAFEGFAGHPTAINCSLAFGQLASSILVDLVPTVMQVRWGLFIALSPARTLTIAGAHPSESGALKYVLQPGYDDGVSNVNSQIANPAPVGYWPNGFITMRYGAAYDMPVAFPSGSVTLHFPILGNVTIASNMLNSPHRANGFFIDQIIDKKFSPGAAVNLPPGLVASGPIPWLSPTGMRQPADLLLPFPYSPLFRMPQHYSYLFSASDHMEEATGPVMYPWYHDTNGERNYEETRVITDAAVFQPYSIGTTGDNAPLLSSPPQVNEYRRGLRITYRTLFKKRLVTRWVWSRRYYLLAGWETLSEFDYVYGKVLK